MAVSKKTFKQALVKALVDRDEFGQVVELMKKRASRSAIISTEIAGYIIESDINHDLEPTLHIYRYGRLLNAFRQAKKLVEADVCSSLESAFEQELEQST